MDVNRKPLMAANWKMYKTIAEATEYLNTLIPALKVYGSGELPDIVICPPATALDRAQQIINKIDAPLYIGAQNMESRQEGAYTGEISPVMLEELGIRYVIIGHSERRQYYNETDESVNAKVQSALDKNITPIICVGESLAQREAGETDSWVEHQVRHALKGLDEFERSRVVFAYEPIWAIGTGKVCEADEANRVIGLIRHIVDVPELRILYGGSMKPDNVEGLMNQREIDGGLVGGASLDPQSFLKLIQAALPGRIEAAWSQT